jgi:isopentenyl-diphosphate delta-isomerase
MIEQCYFPLGVILTEILYHVNEDDEVLGSVSRSEAHLRGLLHRSGMVFLTNSQDKILINMRSSEKETFPSCYDSSVSFHVTYEETYEDSAKRETLEEISIEASLKTIGKFIHKDPPEYQIVSVFLCISDIEPIIDHEEFSSHRFYSITEVERIIKNSKITPWLRDGWKLFIKHF